MRVSASQMFLLKKEEAKLDVSVSQMLRSKKQTKMRVSVSQMLRSCDELVCGKMSVANFWKKAKMGISAH